MKLYDKFIFKTGTLNSNLVKIAAKNKTPMRMSQWLKIQLFVDGVWCDADYGAGDDGYVNIYIKPTNTPAFEYATI